MHNAIFIDLYAVCTPHLNHMNSPKWFGELWFTPHRVTSPHTLNKISVPRIFEGWGSGMVQMYGVYAVLCAGWETAKAHYRHPNRSMFSIHRY